jgi:ATP-dependent DNA helicase RecG
MTTADVEQTLALEVDERQVALISLQEDQWFDRKSSRVTAKDLAASLVGMANAEGGTIVVGIWDGKIEGIRSAGRRVNDWRQTALDLTVPPVSMRFREIECVNGEGQADKLAIIDVETSGKVHQTTADDVFLRVGDENRKLTFMQRQELMYDKAQAFFEASVVTQRFNTLNREVLDQYVEAMHHSDARRLLVARGLITPQGKLTVGAVLLFGDIPQAAYPEAHVRVLRYAGTERGVGARQQLVFDRRIEGPIPVMLQEAERVVFEVIPTRKALTSSGRFEHVGMIPRDVWLEGMVNAVVHRSYSSMGDHIRVEIFDDRVEIESPGRFPGLVDPKEPTGINRFARNPRIARVCADLQFGQELGEGIRRMFAEMQLAGLADPVYRQTSGSVRLVLMATLVDRHLEDRLPPGARQLMRLVREKGRLGTGDLVELTKQSRPSVLKQLESLQESGLVERVGNSRNDPRAYWRLKID